MSQLYMCTVHASIYKKNNIRKNVDRLSAAVRLELCRPKPSSYFNRDL